MEPTKELIDSLSREEILEARRMSVQEKVLAGPRLFDRVCWMMRAGIRQQYPDADDARVEEILRDRLAIARRLEGGG